MANVEGNKIKSRANYRNNKEHCLKRQSEYFQKNKEVIYKQRNSRNRERRKTDRAYCIKSNLRRRLNRYVSGENKPSSAIEELGCSIDFLMKHLESQFTEGMTWDNRGLKGWHVDHIAPLASFDLEDKAQFNKACHYTNLQPLWAIDNLKKGSKIIISYEW
jgi:hypothetical protein